MTRPKVEKAILFELGKKCEGIYSVPTKADEKNSGLTGRFYTFSRIINDSTVNISLRFFGKNGLQLEPYLSVSNKQVDDFLVNNGFQPKQMRKPNVVDFNIESFLSGTLGGAIYLQHGNSLESIDTARRANSIFNRYFDFVQNKCVSKMDSVFNLELLLNDPAQFREGSSLDYRYLWPLQAKIIMGISLAMICKRPDYEEVVDAYTTMIKTKFKPGEHEYIDFCIALLDIKY